jgi:hypothetical protein
MASKSGNFGDQAVLVRCAEFFTLREDLR